MKANNYNPFLYYSNELQTLLHSATKQKDPALWLFNNDVRTTLFMLEALTRIHKKAFDEELFEKWNKRFKKLEDVFGQVDEYAALEKKFSKEKNLSPEVIKYYKVQKENFLEKCNRRLMSKEWFEGKVLKFDSKLDNFEFSYHQHIVDELQAGLVNEIDKILHFTLKIDYHFTKIEDEVHEMRRKLRWLSIYAKAFRGLIQLKKSGKRKKYEINYFTDTVINSPFNKIMTKPEHVSIIEFDKDSFFALSWMIDELGKLKDKALNFYQLRDAIFVTSKVTKEEAATKALFIMKMKPSLDEDVLSEASRLIKIFISKDKILDHLIVQ